MFYSPHPLLRKRETETATVSYSELLFDLIYVFSVTQLSHYLLHNLTWEGLLKETILWFAVWMLWQHTIWVTNWFNPDTRPIRILLFISMLVELVMAMEEEFDIGEIDEDDLQSLKTVGDCVRYLSNHIE